MKEEHKLWDHWLEAALKPMCGHPDCVRVRRELLDHLEDRAEGLRRSFPDLPREEAERMALDGMGDAAEMGQALAQAHSRLLGNLYELGQLLLILTLPLVALEGMFMLWARILPLAVPGWPF